MHSSDTTAGIGGPDHFAAVLNKLFRTRLKMIEDGRTKPYTLREVAQGTGISIGYLSEARRGNIENPSLDKLLLLARFFDVNPTVFVEPVPHEGGGGEGVSRDGARETLSPTTGKEQVVKQIAFRAETFSEVELSMVREMMDVIERYRSRDEGDEAGAKEAEPTVRDRRHSPTNPDVDRGDSGG